METEPSLLLLIISGVIFAVIGVIIYIMCVLYSARHPNIRFYHWMEFLGKAVILFSILFQLTMVQSINQHREEAIARSEGQILNEIISEIQEIKVVLANAELESQHQQLEIIGNLTLLQPNITPTEVERISQVLKNSISIINDYNTSIRGIKDERALIRSEIEKHNKSINEYRPFVEKFADENNRDFAIMFIFGSLLVLTARGFEIVNEAPSRDKKNEKTNMNKRPTARKRPKSKKNDQNDT